MVIHFVEICLPNIKFNWLIRFSKSTRRAMAIHIASLSLIARGKKQIRSVITITSKPGTRDPIVPNAKTRDQVPASPSRSQPIPGFSSPHHQANKILNSVRLLNCLNAMRWSNLRATHFQHFFLYHFNMHG